MSATDVTPLLVDDDFDSVRDPAQREALDEKERAVWESIWNDVASRKN